MAEQGRAWRSWRQPGAWSLTGYQAPDSGAPAAPLQGGPVRVVLVDDSAEVRTLVRTKIRLSGAAVVEGEGADGTDAVDLARRLRPDAMLLDVSMPGMDGLTALPQVLEASPGTRVVMFSGFDEEPLALRALELGAAAYLTKTSALADVVAELAGPATAEPAGEGTAGDVDGSEVLEEQVERFQSVFEDAAIGMATMTLQGSIVRANDALARILGQHRDALLGSPYGAAVGDEPGLAEAVVAIVERGADVVTLEHPAGGDERFLRTTLTVVRDQASTPLYLFAQCQDVTAQRAAELELRASEQRFRLMVDVVRDYAIFMLDTEGHISSWNAGAERTKGWTAGEIIGQHFRTFYPPEQQEARHPEHELEVALREGVYQEEGWRVRKDGSMFWAHVTITAVRDESGRHIGFAKVTRDHTERMELERQLEAAADEQARFLAVTAHELRSPVGVLSNSGQFLAENWDQLDEEERRDLLAGMQSSAGRLQRLLGDLLTTSRLQASRLDLDLQPLDLAETVRPVLQRLRVAHPELEIVADLPPELWATADADRLAQIVDNLVGNAAAHGASPVRVLARAAGEESVEVVVSDAGGGVPAQMREQLFQRFAIRGGGRGTGLGLHIVRELARAQGGDAEYRPEANEFVVCLPRVVGAP